MSGVFGHGYAGVYDALCHNKGYAAERHLIERVFKNHGRNAVWSVLDLVCGTGNHAVPSAARGYEVVAIHCSDEMLGQARKLRQL